MSKKIITMISSCGVMAIALVLLLVFLLPLTNKNLSLNDNNLLKSSAQDITMSVGNKVFNFYQINNKSATISFKVDKQGIINIDETMIEALSVGEVNVVMTASVDKANTKSEFKVKVLANDYKIVFTAIDNCTFFVNEDDKINTYTIGTNANLPELQKVGYDFDSWYTDINLQNEIRTISSNMYGNLDLYPKFNNLFNINTSTGALTSLTITAKNKDTLEIPEKIDGVTITTIESNAFEGALCNTLKISNKITNFKKDCFAGCYSKIGDFAFRNCEKLFTVYVKKLSSTSVIKGGEDMFKNTTITGIYFEDQQHKELYQAQTYWNLYISLFKIDS